MDDLDIDEIGGSTFEFVEDVEAGDEDFEARRTSVLASVLYYKLPFDARFP